MATNKAQAIFLDTLVERCESFVAETSIAKASDYPSKAPKILAECLFEAAEKINSRARELRRAHEQTNKISPLDEIIVEASNIYDFVVFNSSYICPMLRNASIVNVPAEMVLPMETIARSVFPSCQIVIGGVSELNLFLASTKGPTNGTLKGDHHPCRKWRHQFMPSPFSSGSL